MTDRFPVTGMPWYTPETYGQLLAMVEDATEFPATFEEWLARAEKELDEFQMRGIRVLRIHFDANAFSAWTREYGREANAHNYRLMIEEAVVRFLVAEGNERN
jgi:hypothetical protein